MAEFLALKEGANLTDGSVKQHAELLNTFIRSRCEQVGQTSKMYFTVGGINIGRPYGEIFGLDPISGRIPECHFGEGVFGMRWGGQTNIVSRIINGADPSLLQSLAATAPEPLAQWQEEQDSIGIPYQSLPLQDGIDLTRFLVEATAAMQSFTTSQRGVGGLVESVFITPEEGVQWYRNERYGAKARAGGTRRE